MKKILIIWLFGALAFTQQTTSYSWEDGTGTILGSYGNLSNPANVGTTSGVSPFDGSRMLTVSESPIDGTPQAFIAWVTDLSAGQDIEACFYGYDNTSNSAPSLRIWGNWSTNNDITSYAGSADGNADYTDGSGWGQVCHTFSTNQENWDSGEALVIQARLYSSASGPDPTVYFIDLVEVTAPSSAIINYPGTSEGCTDALACNYNAFATDDDGSCTYPEGSISIYDIQYTDVQGDYCYESMHDQECWTTSGTITAKSADYPNFYLQDESSTSYAGIYVHGYSATLPNLGENITITATVNEYYSLTQLIDGSSFSVNSSGNSVTPTDISTGSLASGCIIEGESVESMLVRMSNVSVTQGSNEYGEWYVSDGSGSVMINDKIFDGMDWPAPSVGQEYASIIGVVDYAYSAFSILPRTMSDIVLCPTCPVADAGDDQLVPPETAVVTLNGSNSYDPNGSIIAYEWTQLSGTVVTLLDEEAEITTFTAPDVNGDLVFRLTIYDNDYNEASDDVTIKIGTGTPIMDIQCPDDLVQGTYCYETSMTGDEVATYGVVTHVIPESNDGSAGNFFLQQSGAETCAGIYVRDFDIVPAVGDELTLTGTVNEYYSFTQVIDVVSSSVSSTNNCTTPMTISTSDLGIDCSVEGEYLESMLVRINNITVEGIDEFDNIQVNDGSSPTLMDDYYFDGDWPNFSVGDEFECVTGVVGYSYSEFKIYPRDISDFECDDECDEGGCSVGLGDVNGDGNYNVLDIVQLANCVLQDSCADLDYACASDLNSDGNYNVLDIVQLANCVLQDNCGGRVDDANEATLIKKTNHLYIDSDGFIGGIQMTLKHNSDFSIQLTDAALYANHISDDNETRLIIITPETNDLFSFNGDFDIIEVIVANSQKEISVSIPINERFSLSAAYPNPFNPVTSLEFNLSDASNITIEIYNLQGQFVSTLLNGYQAAGIYSLTWDASHVPSGIYFVKAESMGFVQTQKLMIIK